MKDTKTTKGKVLQIIEDYSIEAKNEEDLASHKDIADELDLSRQAILNHCKDLKQRGDIKQETDNPKRYVPSDFTGSFEPNSDIVKEVKEDIQTNVDELKDRILRNPTIIEVAEEMGRTPDDIFERLFRNTVEEWRSPTDIEIKESRGKVQEKVEKALELHLGWFDPEDLDSKIKEYYDDNEELFYEFKLHTERWGLNGDVPIEFTVEIPAKLGKFMENTDFEIHVPYSNSNETVRDYNISMTEQARKQCVETKKIWDEWD